MINWKTTDSFSEEKREMHKSRLLETHAPDDAGLTIIKAEHTEGKGDRIRPIQDRRKAIEEKYRSME
jgi:hypothetical protein